MGQVIQCHAFTASLQTMIIHEVDMYTQKYYRVILRICFSVLHVGRGETRHCIAVGWFALVAHGSGRAGRLYRALHCVYIRVKKVSTGTRYTLTSDDAITCQTIPGSISDVGSKVITKIVR